MSDVLTDSELTYMELDSKHHLERPLDRANILKLIAEVRDWRSLGNSPGEVEERIGWLEHDLEDTRQNLIDYMRAADKSYE